MDKYIKYMGGEEDYIVKDGVAYMLSRASKNTIDWVYYPMSRQDDGLDDMPREELNAIVEDLVNQNRKKEEK